MKSLKKEKTVRRKKIAFLGSGVYTIPSYRALLNYLGVCYDVTAYFEVYKKVNDSINFSVKTVPRKVSNFARLREVFFGLMIFKSFLFKRPHIIHAHSTFPSGFFAILFGKIFSIPVIVSLDGGEASALPNINFGDLIGPRRRKINALVVQRATKVIVLTAFLKDKVHQNLAKDLDVQVIPRGVDVKKFHFREREIGVPVRIIHVAYLHPVKDQETLLEAFARINKNVNSVLTIIGEDFMSGKIQKKVEELMLQDKVIFERHISNDLMPAKYAEADLMLHTSWYESQAVVINEALACGLLICGTRVGLLSDLSDLCCLTVAPGDAEGLAKLVLQLLKNPEEMKRLRANGHVWATQHDLQWTARQHVEIYESLLKDFSER